MSHPFADDSLTTEEDDDGGRHRHAQYAEQLLQGPVLSHKIISYTGQRPKERAMNECGCAACLWRLCALDIVLGCMVELFQRVWRRLAVIFV